MYSCQFCFFFFKQKTAYDIRISDWSSDVCSSDLIALQRALGLPTPNYAHVPVLLGADGRKLSKSERSDGIDSGDTIALLNRLWALLGQIDVSSEERRVGKEGVSTGSYRWLT